jgi:hypothetical protein
MARLVLYCSWAQPYPQLAQSERGGNLPDFRVRDVPVAERLRSGPVRAARLSLMAIASASHPAPPTTGL